MPSSIRRIKDELLKYKKTGVTDLKSDSFVRYVAYIRRDCPGWIEKNEIFKIFKCPKWTSGWKRRKKKQQSKTTEKAQLKSTTMINDQNGCRTFETIIESPDNIHTAEQLAKLCNIDLNRMYAHKIITNRWNTSALSVCWQIKVEWKNREDPTPEDAANAYVELTKNFNPLVLPNYIHVPGNLLLEVSIVDPHIGRLAWARETGDRNYDLKISTQEYYDSNQYFLDQFKNIEIDKVLLVIGNDFFNSDTAKNMTFNDTPQDEDQRWQKTYEKGTELIINTIELWRKCFPVDVMFIAGNHDYQRLFYLGHNTATAFRNTTGVSINNVPKAHKQYVYGKNLILFAHKFQNEKRATDVLFADYRKEFAGSDCVEIHTGHFHKEKTVESMGNITIRTLPSLAARSSWESDMGFRSLKKAMAFLYEKQGALVDIRYRNIK